MLDFRKHGDDYAPIVEKLFILDDTRLVLKSKYFKEQDGVERVRLLEDIASVESRMQQAYDLLPEEVVGAVAFDLRQILAFIPSSYRCAPISGILDRYLSLKWDTRFEAAIDPTK